MMPLLQKIIITGLSFMMLACGSGNSNSDKKKSSISSSVSSISSSVSSQIKNATLSGLVTYDYIPHKLDHLGLDYQNIQSKPVRGVRVELLDEFDNVLTHTRTDSAGNFEFPVAQNHLIKIRVVARMQSTASPSWDVSVSDNTQQNAIYAIEGQLKSVNSSSEIRDLHAASGWNGSAYAQMRSAAPFAILDTIYSGLERLKIAGLSSDLPALMIYWSDKNTTAEGAVALGEIGTSYFSENAIYLLGDADVDTDEYDAHVILHEWTHYLERSLSRVDSPGGKNDTAEKLDMRLAFSEGFANSFAGMMLDDPVYKDALGIAQATGFFINLDNKSQNLRGWYSQGSISSILYNYYLSGDGRPEKSMQDIFGVVTASNYINTPYFTSIFVFSEFLKQEAPNAYAAWNNLLIEQNINSILASADGETNSGGYVENLPIYKSLDLENPLATLCSSNRFGSINHLSNFQFAKISITSAGQYRLKATNSNQSTTANPDIYLYSRGNLLQSVKSGKANEESMQLSLSVGEYVLTIGDARITDTVSQQDITHCFQLELTEGQML